MKILREYKEDDLLFLDIETARICDKLDADSQLGKAWQLKARYQNELKEKLERDGKEAAGEFLQDFFEEKAALYAPFARIVTVVIGRIIGDTLKVKAFYDIDEKTLLEKFNADLAQFVVPRAGAAITTFNGNGFDLPFITKRMLANGITLPPILDTFGTRPWELRALDLSKLWQNGSFYPDSLASVACALGLPSPKVELSGSEVGDAYYGGKLDEIVKYCKLDVLTTANVYRRFAGKTLLTLAQP